MAGVPGIEVAGITGVTCAGKTSLIDELKLRMPNSLAVLGFDEYDLYPEGSERMARELANPSITNWENPALFEMEQFVIDVGRVAQGQKFRLAARSRESMAAGEDERLFVPKRTNAVEGLLVLHDPRARAVMDLTIFLDIPLDLMVERRLKTLRPGSSGNPWDDPDYIQGPMVEGTQQYVLPQREHAQMVLDGRRPTADLADEVMRTLI